MTSLGDRARAASPVDLSHAASDKSGKSEEVGHETFIFALPLLSMAAAVVASAAAWPAGAQSQQSQQRIYGSQLMTPQERQEYQQRLRIAKSQAERQRIRSEHHVQMQERAREKGITLPGMGPGQSRGGMGPGQGMGPGRGMGPGQGMGPGSGTGGGGGGQ